jgi:hypothetical protein
MNRYKYDTPDIQLDRLLIEREEYHPPSCTETLAKNQRDTIFDPEAIARDHR